MGHKAHTGLRVAAVVPTCRGFAVPPQSIDVDWYVVHDQKPRKITGPVFKNLIAPDSMMFGSRSDSIRSAGFLEAYLDGAEFILTVDDDCTIPINWAADHVQALMSEQPSWMRTVPMISTRGMPKSGDLATTAITHGLWDGVLDLDGETQKLKPSLRWIHTPRTFRQITAPFAQSAMNLGFRREVATVMYQPMQGKDWPFDRFADIWGGLLAQRVLTLHGWGFLNGGAIVEHDRASDCDSNIKKEAPGAKCHEQFWRYVWSWRDMRPTLKQSYCGLAAHVGCFDPEEKKWRPYFRVLGLNMMRWAEMLSESSSLSTTVPTDSAVQ